MSGSMKYTAARLGLFVLLVALLWPLRLNPFVTLLAALLVSAVASFVLLRRWRTEMVGEIDGAVRRRRRRRDDLRAALAGDEDRTDVAGDENHAALAGDEDHGADGPAGRD